MGFRETERKCFQDQLKVRKFGKHLSKTLTFSVKSQGSVFSVL